MNFSELPPSKQWATLKYQGQTVAEVWFKPEGEPHVILFRIPRKSFQTPGVSELLSMSNLLSSINIPTDEMESWQLHDEMHSADDCLAPLQPPAPQEDHVELRVNIKTLVPEKVHSENVEAAPIRVNWQIIETRWNTILGLEANIDSLRLKMEGLRSELEGVTNKTLSSDEKLHGQNADVAIWNKAKSRARYALPKVKEFIHRATWAMVTAERKKLTEIFKSSDQALASPVQLHQLQVELENMMKDRQVLSAQGVTGYQEGKNSSDDVQKALSALQRNAAKKRAAIRAKGKPF